MIRNSLGIGNGGLQVDYLAAQCHFVWLGSAGRSDSEVTATSILYQCGISTNYRLYRTIGGPKPKCVDSIDSKGSWTKPCLWLQQQDATFAAVFTKQSLSEDL